MRRENLLASSRLSTRSISSGDSDASESSSSSSSTISSASLASNSSSDIFSSSESASLYVRPRAKLLAVLAGVEWRLDLVLLGWEVADVGGCLRFAPLRCGVLISGVAGAGCSFLGLPRFPIIMLKALGAGDASTSFVDCVLRGDSRTGRDMVFPFDFPFVFGFTEVLLLDDARLDRAEAVRLATSSMALFSKYSLVSSFLSLMTLYRSVCSLVMGAKRTYSRFLGRYAATSCLMRRNRSGCRMRWIFLTRSFFI